MSTHEGRARFTRGQRLRRFLFICTLDGFAFSVMVGLGETYFPAFVAKMGRPSVFVGLVATLPMVAGGLLQLITPAMVRRVGSNRRWVTTCTSLQALSLLLMSIAAFTACAPIWLVFAIATLYWAGGLGSGPAWTDWMGHEIPHAIRGHYYARRNRWCNVGILVGLLAGGFTLERFAGGVLAIGGVADGGHRAFGALFLAAAICRVVSTALLLTMHERPLAGSGVGSGPAIIKPREILTRLRHGPEGRLLLCLFGIQAAANMAQPYFNPYILAQIRVDYAPYAVLLSAAFAAKMVVFPALGGVVARFGAARLLAWSGMGLIPLPLLWMWADTFTELLIAQLVSGVLWGGYELASFLMFYTSVRPADRTTFYSVFAFGNAASIAGGSVLGGWTLAAAGNGLDGYRTIFILSLAARFMTLILLYRLMSRASATPAPERWPEVAMDPVAVRPASGSVSQPDID